MQPCLTTTPSSRLRDVLAAVGGGFEEVEDLLPLDDDDRIAFLVEERDDGVLVHAVGFAFELIDARGEFERRPACFSSTASASAETVGRVADDVGQPPGAAA